MEAQTATSSSSCLPTRLQKAPGRKVVRYVVVTAFMAIVVSDLHPQPLPGPALLLVARSSMLQGRIMQWRTLRKNTKGVASWSPTRQIVSLNSDHCPHISPGTARLHPLHIPMVYLCSAFGAILVVVMVLWQRLVTKPVDLPPIKPLPCLTMLSIGPRAPSQPVQLSRIPATSDLPANRPHFGRFVCDKCAEGPPSAYPFVSCQALEDLADLYLYRFDETLEYDALARVSSQLRLESGCDDMTDPEFEAEACRAIQDLEDVYFMEDWTNPQLIASNSRRLRTLRRKYLAAGLIHPSSRLDPSVVQNISEKVWDFAINATGGLVLVNITADYCSGCNSLDPIFNAAAETMQERGIANCYRLNGTHNPNIISKLGIKSYPCILLFDDGQEVGRIRYPKRLTYTDIVNFVLDRRNEVDALHFLGSLDVPEDSESEGGLTDYTGPEDQPDDWYHSLRIRGIDMLEEMEADRRNVLLHEKFKALGGSHYVDSYEVPENWRPRILFLGGGMGAGKSTVVRTMATTSFWHDRGERVVIIEADAFKLQDPLFAALLHINVGNAAEIVHNTSTATAEELLLDALQRGRDIVFDGTLSWEPFVVQTVEMVRQAHLYEFERGPGYQEDASGNAVEEYWVRKAPRQVPGQPYIVEMVGVTVDPEVAVQRGIVRQITSGRGVPIRAQLQSHKLYSAHFLRYLEIFDAAVLLDNNGGSLQAHPILVKGDSIMRCALSTEEIHTYDQEAFDRFLLKRFINVNARGRSEVYMQHEMG